MFKVFLENKNNIACYLISVYVTTYTWLLHATGLEDIEP